MSFENLKLRIKKNEGYSSKPYKDQLGFFTIGYGHLIKPNESKYFKHSFKKKFFEDLFEHDFNKALKIYKKLFHKNFYKKPETELLIEMIFQLGPRGVSKFKKMHYHLDKKQKYMVCLEMMDSLWYKQTKERVNNLIKHFVK